MLYMTSVDRLKRYEIRILNGAIYDIKPVLLLEEIFDKNEVSLSVPLAQRFLLFIENSCIFRAYCPFHLTFIYAPIPKFLVLPFAQLTH